MAIAKETAPQLLKLRKEMEEAKAKGDKHTMLAKFQEQRKLYKERGISPFSAIQGAIVNGLLTVPLFFALNNISKDVPGMHQAGMLWFSDLSVPDPYYVLPTIAYGLMFLNNELNTRDSGNTTQTPGQKKAMRAVTLLFGLFGATCSAAITLMWTIAYSFQAIQQRLLRTRRVRRMLSIQWTRPSVPMITNGQPTSFSTAWTEAGSAKSFLTSRPIINKNAVTLKGPKAKLSAHG